MDAVKLPVPVDVVSASKLMGSEGFARTGVTVQELEACESDGVSVIASRSIEYRSTIDISEKCAFIAFVFVKASVFMLIYFLYFPGVLKRDFMSFIVFIGLKYFYL